MKKLEENKLCAKQNGDTRQLAEAANTLGDKYVLSEDFSKALEEYTKAAKAYEIFGVNLERAVVYRRLGEVNMNLGRYECAIKHLNRHLEEVQKLQNEVEEQRGFATLGRTYYLLAHTLPERSAKQAEALANAREAYNKSILLCDNELEGVLKKELIIMRARLLLNQGLVLYDQMECDEGIGLIESAIKLSSRNNLNDESHRAYIALSGLYGEQGNINLAVEMLDRAVETEDKSTKGDATLAKAQLFFKNGKWSDAQKVLAALYPDKSLSQSLRQQLDKFLRIAVTLCRGEQKLKARNIEIDKLKLYEELGDAAAAACCYDKALEYYQEMLNYAQNDGSYEKISAALISLAKTFKDAGRYEEALPFAMRELEMCSDHREACRTALFLAELLESGRSDSSKIIDMLTLALSKAESSGDSSLEVTVLQDYLHYLDSQKSKLKTRLDLLSDRMPDLASQREVPHSQVVGADISLDELLDVEPFDEEQNRDEPGTSMSNNNRRYSITKNRVKNLSSMAESEYESIHNELDAEGVKKRKKKRMDIEMPSSNEKFIELIQLDEDSDY